MAHILLAEDDDQMRAFFSRGLRRVGHAAAPHQPRIVAKPFYLRHRIAKIDALLSPKPAK